MKRFYPILGLIVVLFLVIFSVFISRNSYSKAATPTPSSSPSSSLRPIPKTAKKADAYTIILVGDSMTNILGENTDYLRTHLKEHYGNKVFGIFNYALGSQSILYLDEKLHHKTPIWSKDYPPILDRDFEVIIIESFANNPLSQFPLEKGLKIQTDTLDNIVNQIHRAHPNSVIALMATIAPSRKHYGEGIVDLSPEVRAKWADERIAYINNHIKYAKDHNLPLINVYEKSLRNNGEVDESLLNDKDYIHPSANGVDFISKTIADYLYNEKVLLP